MAGKEKLLRAMYAGFNARAMEAVLAAMHEDVLWANGMEGGHVQGREGVRAYWTRQWAILDPRVDPVSIVETQDGTLVVEVHQVVHDKEGKLLVDQMVGHIFRIEDGLVRRFDIRGAEQERKGER
ncbi:MAG TPA: nuclear transport factor 2 family protein [Acidobacteriaceae bacterium]|nr:nuclear transport factor 2 family protein [Acidobacteriaceae bacterium]